MEIWASDAPAIKRFNARLIVPNTRQNSTYTTSFSLTFIEVERMLDVGLVSSSLLSLGAGYGEFLVHNSNMSLDDRLLQARGPPVQGKWWSCFGTTVQARSPAPRAVAGMARHHDGIAKVRPSDLPFIRATSLPSLADIFRYPRTRTLTLGRTIVAPPNASPSFCQN